MIYMDANEMLAEVRRCKELGVEAVITDSHGADILYRLATDKFLTSNREQILDILDDALTAHLGGK